MNRFRLPLDVLSLALVPLVWFFGIVPLWETWHQERMSLRKLAGDENRLRALEKTLQARGFEKLDKALFESDSDFARAFQNLCRASETTVVQESVEHGEGPRERVFHGQLAGSPAGLRGLLVQLETLPRAVMVKGFEFRGDGPAATLVLDLSYLLSRGAP